MAKIDALVPGLHPSRSDAVRRAVEFYVYRMACEKDAEVYGRMPLTDRELALAEDPEGWSATAPW